MASGRPKITDTAPSPVQSTGDQTMQLTPAILVRYDTLSGPMVLSVPDACGATLREYHLYQRFDGMLSLYHQVLVDLGDPDPGRLHAAALMGYLGKARRTGHAYIHTSRLPRLFEQMETLTRRTSDSSPPN